MDQPGLQRGFVAKIVAEQRDLGDPAGRIKCPTVAQEMLYGAKGRVYQLREFLKRHSGDILVAKLDALQAFLERHTDDIERDADGQLVAETLDWIPDELHGMWRRQWIHAWEKGTRQLVPAMVDCTSTAVSLFPNAIIPTMTTRPYRTMSARAFATSSGGTRRRPTSASGRLKR